MFREVDEKYLAHFKIVELIGQGAMGLVYRAIDTRDGSLVALKVFYPDTQLTSSQQDELLRRFEKEAEILKNIKHENIVGYREFGHFNGKEYLAMEFLEGQNLKELMEMNVAFSLPEVVDIGMQVLSGLALCHEKGIIHRDIKPANIVMLPSGTVKLTDFGIARILADATISKAGSVVGTPNYMSPEQIKGMEITPSSDLFSLGVILYELLTKVKPFDGDSITTIMYNVVNLTPPPISHFNPNLSGDVAKVINRGLAKSPQERYQSAREFQKDLLALIQELPVTSPAPQETSPQSPTNTSTAVRKVLFCVDCGTANPYDRLTCLKCKLPLLRRENIPHSLTNLRLRIPAEASFDRALLIFLNSILAGIIIFIIYLFFRG